MPITHIVVVWMEFEIKKNNSCSGERFALEADLRPWVSEVISCREELYALANRR